VPAISPSGEKEGRSPKADRFKKVSTDGAQSQNSFWNRGDAYHRKGRKKSSGASCAGKGAEGENVY